MDRLLRKPRHRWENNISKNIKEIEREDSDYIHPAQDMDQ